MKLNKLTVLFTLLLVLNGCATKEEIIFDHELPQFEIKSDAILLEVIVPQGTSADDKLYIVGEFNGGDQAIGDMEWQLEKAANSDTKWGIYLYPESFVGDKTLSDGFYFYSTTEGYERTLSNEQMLHTIDVELGSRTNVWMSRWESYFMSDPDGPTDDGYIIYVDNQSGWDELSMYCWGDAEIAGAWPGIPPSGTKILDDVEYTYFELGEDATGLNLNPIFNNNDNGKQLDAPNIILNRDYYFILTDSSCEEVVFEDITYNYTLYVDDQSGWGELSMYCWGDAEVAGGWPGVQPSGKQSIEGVEYTYFELEVSAEGMSINPIFNNNGNGLQLDAPNIILNRDYYFILTDSSCEEITN
ncbi:MAG: hypothetical protein SNI51_08490 [Rikenellaceae bacterium]